MKPLKAVFTDANGLFDLDGLPVGNYILYPEVTGEYARISTAEVTDAHPETDTLTLFIYDQDITGINNTTMVNRFELKSVFPNPASDKINLLIESPALQILNLRIFSITGEELISKTLNCGAGPSIHPVFIGELKKGIFFLKVETTDATDIRIGKIIKQ